jgi:uncharacterized protein
MIAGVLYIEMHLPAVTNLKAKRQILSSLKAKLHNKFNISVSEVAFHDLWQRCALGVAAVAPDRAALEHILQRALAFVDNRDDLQVTGHRLEFF